MDLEHKLRTYAETPGIHINTDTTNILHPADRLHTLARELDPATHGHRGHPHPRNERRADDFAANFLVDPIIYKAAEVLYGSPLPPALSQKN